MRMMLCHLTGSLRGRTQYLDTDSVSFGIGNSCGVVFDGVKDPGVCPVHAELNIEDQQPVIRDMSGRTALLVNGEPKVEATLKDGDLIQFGEDGPLVRFRLHPDGAPFAKPWPQIVADSRDIVVRTPHPRPLSALYLAQHLLADVVRYGSPAVKLAALLVVLVPAAVIAVLAVALQRQYQATGAAERQRLELVRQLETGRLTQMELEQRVERERERADTLDRRREELERRLAALSGEQAAARRAREEVKALRRQLGEVERSQRFAEEIVGRFGAGVALLQGGYGFREKGTGRLLRYQGFDPSGNPLLDGEGNTLVTLEGQAPPIVIYYAGTGFLLDKAGTIVTNRHLVRMWEQYEPAQQAIRSGLEPDLWIFRAFFPGAPEPSNLKVVAVSEKTDLALLRAEAVPAGAVPLALLPAGQTPLVGEPVVVLSYPGSFEGILGRVGRPTSDEVIRESKGDPQKLAASLARHGLIRPLVTQGHVSDATREAVTFEAGAATGSSGGPVLDRNGRVIAVNYGVLQKAGRLNVGLPAELVWALLQQAAPAPDPPAGPGS